MLRRFPALGANMRGVLGGAMITPSRPRSHPELDHPSYWRKRARVTRELMIGETGEAQAVLGSIADAYEELARRSEERLETSRQSSAPHKPA